MLKIGLVVIVLGILIYYIAFLELQAVRKYYPELSFWEYMLIEDKLRITPEKG